MSRRTLASDAPCLDDCVAHPGQLEVTLDQAQGALPIDPKLIITIGPSMRPCRGQWVMASDLLKREGGRGRV